MARLSDTAQITINVTNVDEIPVITLLGDSPYVTVEASNTARLQRSWRDSSGPARWRSHRLSFRVGPSSQPECAGHLSDRIRRRGLRRVTMPRR